MSNSLMNAFNDMCNPEIYRKIYGVYPYHHYEILCRFFDDDCSYYNLSCYLALRVMYDNLQKIPKKYLRKEVNNGKS